VTGGGRPWAIVLHGPRFSRAPMLVGARSCQAVTRRLVGTASAASAPGVRHSRLHLTGKVLLPSSIDRSWTRIRALRIGERHNRESQVDFIDYAAMHGNYSSIWHRSERAASRTACQGRPDLTAS
jgi:hypothetical protein